jgi:hypothetical protein
MKIFNKEKKGFKIYGKNGYKIIKIEYKMIKILKEKN